jgi:hypothetical protein
LSLLTEALEADMELGVDTRRYLDIMYNVGLRKPGAPAGAAPSVFICLFSTALTYMAYTLRRRCKNSHALHVGDHSAPLAGMAGAHTREASLPNIDLHCFLGTMECLLHAYPYVVLMIISADGAAGASRPARETEPKPPEIREHLLKHLMGTRMLCRTTSTAVRDLAVPGVPQLIIQRTLPVVAEDLVGMRQLLELLLVATLLIGVVLHRQFAVRFANFIRGRILRNPKVTIQLGHVSVNAYLFTCVS